MMLKLDTQTPAEVKWAKLLYEEKVLPDMNLPFAKTLVMKTFNKVPIMHLLFAAAAANTLPKNRIHRVSGLRKAVKHLEQLRGITIFGVLYDEETVARLNKANSHIEKGERILVEVLREIEAEDLRLKSQSVEEIKMLLGKLICELKKAIETENKRRKSCKPRLPVYRNEWKIVVELLKRRYPPTEWGHIYYTPSVQAVRQFAYRYKRRRKQKKVSLKG